MLNLICYVVCTLLQDKDEEELKHETSKSNKLTSILSIQQQSVHSSYNHP